MPLPKSKEARPFHRAARQRIEDAEILLANQRTTGAVYMAGYAVECMLKALLLERTPTRRRAEILARFTGAKAHSFNWLKLWYLQAGGEQLPENVQSAFAGVGGWSVSIRYEGTTMKARSASIFMDSVRVIMDWAEGRY